MAPVPNTAAANTGRIRAGIGGWTFAPWRGVFYPAGLPQARELEYASRQLTSIEINGTFYGPQSPASFQRWHDETPDDFVFSMKAPRSVTYKRELAEAGPAIERFFATGVGELKGKLGPILWQLAPTRRFEAGLIDAFLGLLPKALDGHPLRHVLEAAHASFSDPAAIALLRRHGVAQVLIDSDKKAMRADATADFVYARLQQTQSDQPTGYPPADLDRWAQRFQGWAAGTPPADLALAAPDDPAPAVPRDCFVYFISGAKERAPAAARAFIERISGERIGG